jgi:hypothetical protein
MIIKHHTDTYNDINIMLMRSELGIEGYGIYWFLVERLHEANGKLPFATVPALAASMQVEQEKVLAVIKKFNLFDYDEQFFFLNIKQKKPRKEPEKTNVIQMLPHGERFRQAWDNWLQYRSRELKKPVTKTSAARQLKMLASLTEQQAITSIERSICNGWIGLFPPPQVKQNANGNIFWADELQKIVNR